MTESARFIQDRGECSSAHKKKRIVRVSKAHVRPFYRGVSPKNASVRENNPIVRLLNPNVSAGDAYVRPKNPNVSRRNPIVRGRNYIVSQKNPIVSIKNACASDSLRADIRIYAISTCFRWRRTKNML